MTDRKPAAPTDAQADTRADDRARRLAEALRANLRRRKARARAQHGADGEACSAHLPETDTDAETPPAPPAETKWTA